MVTTYLSVKIINQLIFQSVLFFNVVPLYSNQQLSYFKDH